MVRASPSARNDVDLETLNGPNGLPGVPGSAPPPAVPPPQAAANAPAVPDPPAAEPEAAAPKAKPKPGSTVIKAVAVASVTGAPGQGNAELAAAMRKVLAGAGWPVASGPRPDALSITAQVKLDPPGATTQTVHITWVVASPRGRVLGTVGQTNGVPPHSLDASWGETAGLAAQAASDGIFKLVGQNR
jgi:hypothetical protein